MANQTTPAIQVKDSNVGIGTASPRTKTEFVSGLPTSIPTHSNTTNGVVVTDGGDIYGRIGVSNFSAGGNGYPTYIQAGDWSGAIYYNLLLSPLGGNVGIGTTAPTAKLHVQGTSYFFDQSIFSDKVGIGTSNPVVKTHIVGPTLSTSSETTYPLWLSDTGDTTKALILGLI
jgi:hypothetical protein